MKPARWLSRLILSGLAAMLMACGTPGEGVGESSHRHEPEPLPELTVGTSPVLVIPDESLSAVARTHDFADPDAPDKAAPPCPCKRGEAGAKCRQSRAHRALCTPPQLAAARSAKSATGRKPGQPDGSGPTAPAAAPVAPAPKPAASPAAGSSGPAAQQATADKEQPRMANLMCGAPPLTERSRQCLIKLQKVCNVPVQSPEYTQCLMAIATVGAQAQGRPRSSR